jgi:two-component system, cell cycle response regulator DivK
VNDELIHNILVVEDDDNSFMYILFALEELNYKIIRAVNGVEAIELFKDSKVRFDFVIMDLKLPLVDGYQATDEIRKIDPNIKIILQTASYLPLINQTLNDYQFTAVISKPFSVNQLFEAIKKVTSLEKNTSPINLLHDI